MVSCKNLGDAGVRNPRGAFADDILISPYSDHNNKTGTKYNDNNNDDNLTVYWVYKRLDSTIKPGPDGRGCIITEPHWKLTEKGVQPDAILTHVENVPVSRLEFGEAKRYVVNVLCTSEKDHRVVLKFKNPSQQPHNNNQIRQTYQNPPHPPRPSHPPHPLQKPQQPQQPQQPHNNNNNTSNQSHHNFNYNYNNTNIPYQNLPHPPYNTYKNSNNTGNQSHHNPNNKIQNSYHKNPSQVTQT